MDELELLKKDWKKTESSYPKLSYNEIYKLIHKKSSSIVKWLFIICLAEFVFWNALNLFIPESYLEIYEKFNLKTALYISQAIHYLIIFGFMFLFYKNFKSISVIDNTSILMKKIIKTRKTLNYYVYYNLALIFIISIAFNLVMLSDSELLMEVFNIGDNTIDEDKFFNIFVFVQMATLVIVLGLLWLCYRIIYGILLRKLTKNYKELESLEF